MDSGHRQIDPERLAEAVRDHVRELSEWRLTASSVKLGAKVAYGASCDVFLARQPRDEQWYKTLANYVTGHHDPEVPQLVVKRFRVEGDRIEKLRVVVAFIRELVVWSRFEHPNVLRLKGFYVGEIAYTYAGAVTEWQANGNVLQYIRRTRLGDADLLSLVHDVASGLAYLHSLKPPVCHGDVKPENALVSQERRAVLCDFGISRTIGDDLYLMTESRPITIRYASPEVMTDPSIRTLQSDVWSFGCLAYRLLSKPAREPYEGLLGPGPIHSAALAGKLPGKLEDLSVPYFKDIITSCWAYAPEERPPMKQVQQAIQAAKEGNFDQDMLTVFRGDGVSDGVSGESKSSEVDRSA